jgi:hypothetical protein
MHDVPQTQPLDVRPLIAVPLRNMRTLSLAVTVLLSSMAAMAQPIVGPEVVSAPLANSSAASRFSTPAVAMARDRAGVAIAWSMPAESGERIFLTRLDGTAHATGVTRAIPAADGGVDAFAPSLAAAPDGNGFAMTWIEVAPSRTISAMYCRLDATLQPSEPTRLGLFATLDHPPIVRSDRSTWITVDRLLWRVQADGSLIGPANTGLSASDMIAGDVPQLVGSYHGVGPEYTCAALASCQPDHHSWEPCQPTPGCRTYLQSYQLFFLSSVPQSVSFNFGNDTLPAMETDGRGTLIVWMRGAQGSGGSVVAARVDSPDQFAAAVQSPRVVGTFTADALPSTVDVASDGERFLIVWRTKSAAGDHDIVAASLDRDGRVVNIPIASTSISERAPSVIALANSTFLVAWEKVGAGERRIAGRIITFGSRRRTSE